jgi:enterochelin esterase-like enzyme
VRAALWAAAGAEPGQPLPLLVVHDGSETAELTSLLRFLDVLADQGTLGPFRAAFLDPVDRDRHYSASALYARALERDLLPAVEQRAPASVRAGMGASLGALALLHAHLRSPQLLQGLFLQSGSFFRARTDPQESGFPHFARITRFVGSVLRGAATHPVPVTLTCGLGEENLTNNRAVAAALADQGYDVTLAEVRDAHTWTGWRDAYDPWLADLLGRAWR